MLQKALVLKLEYFETHLKVHYTKGFRLYIPILLPTSVAGIFADLFSFERKEAMENFKSCNFCAILADGNVNKVIENSTFMQYGRNIRGVANAYVLLYPVYYLAIQSENIEEIRYTINQGIEYTPFGVQNDYFAKN